MDNLTTRNDLARQDFSAEVGETTPISWQAPTAMTYDEWAAIGRTFQQLGRSLNWWLGDWLNHGEQRWGEMYAQALEMTGMAMETLSKYKSVAARVPADIRREELSWSHHFAVAYAPAELRGPLLEIAARYDMNSRDLKEIMRMDVAGVAALVEGYEEQMPYVDFSRMANRIRLGLPDQGIINGQGHTLVTEEEASEEAASEETPASRVHHARELARRVDALEDDDDLEHDDLEDDADSEEWETMPSHGNEPVYIEEVFAFFDESGAPLSHCLPDEVAWHGLVMRAALDARGRPVLIWEKTHETQSKETP